MGSQREPSLGKPGCHLLANLPSISLKRCWPYYAANKCGAQTHNNSRSASGSACDPLPERPHGMFIFVVVDGFSLPLFTPASQCVGCGPPDGVGREKSSLHIYTAVQAGRCNNRVRKAA